MKKSAVIILIAGLMGFASCNKNDSTDDPTPEQTSVLDYFKLTPGNYWVYEQNYYDSSGNVLAQNWGNDTITVINDTVINSNQYHRTVEYNFAGTSSPDTCYYRDSSGCIVDNNGNIVFSLTPGYAYTRYYDPDTLAYIDFSFISQTSGISVPAGTFDCVDYLGKVYRKQDGYSVPYLIHNYYCKNTGLIKRSRMFLGALYRLELELVSCHI